VNVLVETEWGTSDCYENVDVFVQFKGRKVDELVMIREMHQECRLKLISGVVAKIIDPATGKVLKTYKN
jgi:hypothetical protein